VPCYEHVCDCGWKTEDLYRRHHDAPDTDVPVALECPSCGGRATRPVSKTYVNGPVFEGLERFNNALVPHKMRKERVEVIDGELCEVGPLELKTAKDIERFEESQGLVRTEPGSDRWNQVIEAQKDDASSIEAAVRTGGMDGGGDYIAKTEIQESLGWGETRYNTWKSQTDEAQRSYDADAAG